MEAHICFPCVCMQDDERLTPKLIKASIMQGTLHVLGTRIPLPIK